MISIGTLVLVYVGLSSAIETFYMDQYCGSDIDMVLQDIEYGRLAIDGFSTGDCNVTIETWFITNRMHLRFELLDFGGDCDKTYLTVYDGQNPEFDSKIHGLQHVCAQSVQPDGDFTTTGRYVTFRFVNKDATRYNQMRVIFTAFHTGYCYSYEYDCSNGRCIDDDANCNGFDPCGDRSDCKWSAGTIVGVVLGVFGVVIFATVFTLLIRNRRRRSRTRGRETVNIGHTPYETTSATAINRTALPSYGVAHQYSAPTSYNITTSIQGEK